MRWESAFQFDMGRSLTTWNWIVPLVKNRAICIAAEVVSVGWKIKEQIIVKPVVRPLFRAI